MRISSKVFCLVVTFFVAAPLLGDTPGADAVLEILSTLRTNNRGDQVSCAGCHRPGSPNGSDLFDDIRDLSDLKTRGLIRAGDPDASRLYQALVRPRRFMPLGAERLSARELKLIHDWIAGGAPVTTEAPGATRVVTDFVSEDQLVTWIQEDLAKQPAATRPFLRYFSSVHLYNAGLEGELPGNQLALVKLINSLSWEKDVIPTEKVDERGLIQRLDIRRVGWTARTWETIAGQSPYQTVRPLPPELGTEKPVVRTDWFVYSASRPPLYFSILDLPSTEQALEAKLKIHPTDADAMRVGVTLSDVAIDKNRVLERHPYGDAGYWKSYDFASNLGTQNILEHPLDFRRSGGEIIFGLPNGLQAYFVVNGLGERLDEAPVGIVQDPARRHGGFTVLTGISCMRCHANGMRRRTDEVRAHAEGNAGSFSVNELADIRRLYPLPALADGWFTHDESRFLGALRKFGAENAPEPISLLAKLYEDPLPLETVAAELGLTASQFRSALDQDTELSRELGVLKNRGTIDRARFLQEFAKISAHAANPGRVAGENRGKSLYRWSVGSRNTVFSPPPAFSGRPPQLNKILFIGSMPAISPAVLRDSTIVLPAGQNSELLLWLKDGKEKTRLSVEDPVQGIIPLADDSVAATTRGGDMVWAKNGQVTFRLALHTRISRYPAVLYDGTLVVASIDGTVFWLREGREIHRFRMDKETFGRISILGDDVVFVGGDQHSYWLRDGEQLARADFGSIGSAILPNGNLVNNNEAFQWLDQNRNEIFHFKSPKRLVLQDPAVLADGTLVFTPLGGEGLYWVKNGEATFVNDADRVNERGLAAYADGTVVTSSDWGYVYYYKDGQQTQEVGLGEVMEAEPVILPDGQVVIGVHDNHIYWIK